MSHPVCIQAAVKRRAQVALAGLPPMAALVWLIATFCLTAAGCAPGRTPELLEIYDVTPGAIEHNARLEVLGMGFPDRRRARLTLTGTVYRPGEAPRSLVAPFAATAESSSVVALSITGDVLQSILGGSGRATFRGRVTVTFDSLHGSGPALSGSLDNVILDWFGDASTRRSSERMLQQEAQRFLEFAGFQADESLTVTQVQAGGEAERTGLAPGDQLLALDGVRLDTLSDFVPREDGWQSIVTVRREQGEHTLPSWDRTGFRPAQLTDVPRAAIWVIGASLLLFVTMGARARWWALVEDRLAGQRSEARRGRLTRPPPALSQIPAQLLAACNPSRLSRQLSPSLRLTPYALFFFVFALWSAVALGDVQVLAWIDFPTLILTVLASVLVAALLLGGQRSAQQGWQLSGGLRAAAATLVVWIPVIAAVLGVVFEVGSLRLVDLVAGQGPLPHQWRASTSPWALTALVLLVAVCIPEAGPRRSPWSRKERPTLGASLARLLEWFAIALTCGLGAALFLGGWNGEQEGQPLVSPIVGAALFLVKTWLLLHAVLWWRSVLDGIRHSEVFAAWACRALPLALGSTGLQIAATSHNWTLAYGRDLQLATLAILMLVGGFFLLRAVRALTRPTHHVAINPWL